MVIVCRKKRPMFASLVVVPCSSRATRIYIKSFGISYARFRLFVPICASRVSSVILRKYPSYSGLSGYAKVGKSFERGGRRDVAESIESDEVLRTGQSIQVNPHPTSSRYETSGFGYYKPETRKEIKSRAVISKPLL